MNLVEQATLNFYAFETRGRGYYLFNDTVALEPPFLPFQPVQSKFEQDFDDGCIPNIVTRIGKALGLNPKREIEYEYPEPQPKYLPATTALRSLSVRLPPDTEIMPLRMVEVLSSLTFSESSLSFEIIALENKIDIRFTGIEADLERIASYLKAYFPMSLLRPEEAFDFGINPDSEVAIVDFGIDDECLLPIAHSSSFQIDPLTPLIALMDSLHNGEVAMLQVLFKGVTAPWTPSMRMASRDGHGRSFLPELPHLVEATDKKTATPLFAVVLRIAAQGNTQERTKFLGEELARIITRISTSEDNRLIPLANEGYNLDEHLGNLYFRSSHRSGFLVNAEELAHIVHYPNRSVVSRKLGIGQAKTKEAPEEVTRGGITIGMNEHYGNAKPINLPNINRLSHTHIVGATGTGKSTLISTMVIEDMKAGNGAVIFDPHGDLIDDILKRVPEERVDDVILVDPSDFAFPIGFNLLEANTEAERIVLTSDLVSAFKRHATAWGDNMTAVLQNAVATMLESSRVATLIELKRFLLEPVFRKQFLQSVDDPSLHYYWEREYPMVKKGIAPLLTRIDTFLRPKIIRYMLAQTSGLDISDCMASKKIILLKLPQGLIGQDNAYLLGSLFLAKFNQAAMARQHISRQKRHPYFIYLDEFQDMITPSIEKMLSGTRKYGVGLILAHQNLAQIEDPKLSQSILTNPFTRIAFRLGEGDAKRIAEGFSYFASSDLTELSVGQAIMWFGTSQNDFNLTTSLPASRPARDMEVITKAIIRHSRERYARPREEVKQLLENLLPTIPKKDNTPQPLPDPPTTENEPSAKLHREEESSPTKKSGTPLELQKEDYLEAYHEEQQKRRHRTLQEYVRSLGQERGYMARLEEQTSNGGRVDVGLTRNERSIAVEISVTNSLEYEVENLFKGLQAGYTFVYLIAENKTHLKNILQRAKATIDKERMKKVVGGSPEDFLVWLDAQEPTPKKSTKRIRGYRVKTKEVDINPQEASSKSKTITDIIKNYLSKKPKK